MMIDFSSKFSGQEYFSGIDHVLFTFLDSKFSQLIHSDHSNEYKITSAIAERFMSGFTDKGNLEIGGMLYPSVAHSSRNDNIALRPAIVDKYLRLDYVEELKVIGVKDDLIEVEYVDFGKPFANGVIDWKGRVKQYTVNADNPFIKVKVIEEGYVFTDKFDRLVDPN